MQGERDPRSSAGGASRGGASEGGALRNGDVESVTESTRGASAGGMHRRTTGGGAAQPTRAQGRSSGGIPSTRHTIAGARPDVVIEQQDDDEIVKVHRTPFRSSLTAWVGTFELACCFL